MPEISYESCVIQNYSPNFIQKNCKSVIQQGPIPKHVAFIMDGNRRYATRLNLPSVTDGHKKGEDKLLQVINMCLDLGIQECTFYSLSEDNLKRSPEEVKGILDLTVGRMQKLCDGKEEMKRLGIRWNVIGNWKAIPSKKLKCLLLRACETSKDNQTLTVNLAFAYSARQQICEGISSLVEGLMTESIELEDLNESLLQNCFEVKQGYHPVDILIRTGGDSRLSDFLLWQASTAYLEIIGVTWPEFEFWHLLKTIFRYQVEVVFKGIPCEGYYWNLKNIEINNAKKCDSNLLLDKKGGERSFAFIEEFKKQGWEKLAKIIEA